MDLRIELAWLHWRGSIDSSSRICYVRWCHGCRCIIKTVRDSNTVHVLGSFGNGAYRIVNPFQLALHLGVVDWHHSWGLDLDVVNIFDDGAVLELDPCELGEV